MTENPIKYYEREILEQGEERCNRLVHECLGVILCDENGEPRFADNNEALKYVVWGAKIGVGKNRQLKRAEKKLSQYVADTIFNNYSEAVLTNDIQAIRLTNEIYDRVRKFACAEQKLAMAYLRYILCWAAADGTIEENVEQKLADVFKENMDADFESRGIKMTPNLQINFANMPEKQRERERKYEEEKAQFIENQRKELKKREKIMAQLIEQAKKTMEATIADGTVRVQEIYQETIKLLDARYQAECAQNKSATENTNAMLAQLENEYDNLGMFNPIRKMEISNKISSCRTLLANLAAYKERLDYDYNAQTANAAKKQQDELAKLQRQQRQQWEARNIGIKKNSRKATETQLENEGYKELILDYLIRHDQATCSDMIQNIDTFRDLMLSNQRVSAICRAMVDEGTIEEKMIAGKVFFSIALSYTVEEDAFYGV